MREKLIPAAIAKRSAVTMAGLILVATIDVAGANTSTGSDGASVRFGQQQSVMLAETVTVTKSKYGKETSHKIGHGSGKTWLNPQPEPPMGRTWLNPQPEPPRPVTGTKKLH